MNFDVACSNYFISTKLFTCFYRTSYLFHVFCPMQTINRSLYDSQGRIQGVFEAGIPVWAPKFCAQKIFSDHFIFNGVLCVNLFFNQIQSKGLKKVCDCTLKLRLVYIN